MGNLEKSRHLYYEAYYLFEVFGDEANITIMQKEMKEHLGIEPLY